MKSAFSLKNSHHDFNIERFKTRLMAKSCVIFISLAIIIFRIIMITTTPKMRNTTRIGMYVSFPLLAMIALTVCFEYLLYRKIGPKVMNYSRIIDIFLLIFFTAEWITSFTFALINLSGTGPPSYSPASLIAFATFGYRTVFLLFLIQGWKFLIIPPTLAMLLMISFGIHYRPDDLKFDLLLGIPPIIYTIVMMYFLDKIKWKEVFLNTQQERWTQINQFVLNNIPENIVILELGGEVNFVSEYCKAFMRRSHLTQNPHDLFTNIIDLNQQPDTEPSDTSREENFITIHAMLEENFEKAETLQELIANFTTLINGSQLREKEFLIYNGKLQVQDHHTKAIEIKISYIQQSGRKHIILIIRDTTQRDLLVTLEDNNKYKDQLLASVSHELRAPLNGNISLLESALHEKAVPSSIKENLLIPALRSGKFLLHLINDILDMSQIKAQKLRLTFKSAKLQETLKDTLQLVELHAKKKGLELRLNIDPEIIRNNLCTDHVRLSQIVLNLLNNAIKFTQRGSITLSAIPTEDPALLKISVQDSGMGMTKENMKSLFSNYTHIEFAERKEVNPNGVGLGLSIAYNLSKLLGPASNQGIIVESTPNEGSTFSFIIENKTDELEISMNKSPSQENSKIANEMEICEPSIASKLLQQPTSANFLLCQRVTTAESENSKCACPKILIVDDNPFNTVALETVLGALQLKCDSVFNGQTAIEKILDRQKTFCGSSCKPYCIVFMDQEMPGMNGSETVEEIRNLQIQGLVSPMKIVGCTAHGSTEEVEKFMKSGLDMCIQKPIKALEIQKILQCEDLSSPLS